MAKSKDNPVLALNRLAYAKKVRRLVQQGVVRDQRRPVKAWRCGDTMNPKTQGKTHGRRSIPTRRGIFAVFGLLAALGLPPTKGMEMGTRDLSITGTSIVAATCKDGPLIASDSRFTMRDKNHKDTNLAYVDNMQKVFPVGPHLIATSEEVLFGDRFFSAVVEDFVQQAPVPPSVTDLLPAFLSYCRRTCSPAVLASIAGNGFFAVGYRDRTPAICVRDPRQRDEYQCAMGGPTLIALNASDAIDKQKEHLDGMTAETVAGLAERSIREYQEGGSGAVGSGGRTTIALVSSSGLKWLRSEPTPPRWRTVAQFIADYWRGRVPFVLIPPATKAVLDATISPTLLDPQDVERRALCGRE